MGMRVLLLDTLGHCHLLSPLPFKQVSDLLERKLSRQHIYPRHTQRGRKTYSLSFWHEEELEDGSDCSLDPSAKLSWATQPSTKALTQAAKMKKRLPAGRSLIMYGTDLAIIRLNNQCTLVVIATQKTRISKGKISAQ
jgi:hypothetical protein